MLPLLGSTVTATHECLEHSRPINEKSSRLSFLFRKPGHLWSFPSLPLLFHRPSPAVPHDCGTPKGRSWISSLELRSAATPSFRRNTTRLPRCRVGSPSFALQDLGPCLPTPSFPLFIWLNFPVLFRLLPITFRSTAQNEYSFF